VAGGAEEPVATLTSALTIDGSATGETLGRLALMAVRGHAANAAEPRALLKCRPAGQAVASHGRQGVSLDRLDEFLGGLESIIHVLCQ
jgi:hypothetical protein